MKEVFEMYTKLKKNIKEKNNHDLQETLNSKTWGAFWLRHQNEEKISDLCFFIDELKHNILNENLEGMLDVFEDETRFSEWINLNQNK